MRRYTMVARGAAAVLAIAALAACDADRGVGPTAGTPAVAYSKRSSGGSGKVDTSVTVFTIQPGKSITQSINGGHKLVIPANALCDPATTPYGPSYWETPCAAATAPVTVTAKSWINASGHPAVDFSPELRFTPNDSKAVTLYMLDKTAATDPSFRILYCASSLSCVDESILDPEVATKTDAKNGFLYRRVKHFSGYNIASGYASSDAL